MEFDDFENFAQFLAYCKEHGSKIFVRTNCTGKWESMEFSLVPFTEQREHAERWWNREVMPAMLA